MTCKTLYEFHHNFPKLAEETSFTFNTHRSRVRIDWNKIKQIDIESIIRERKFNFIEQHVNDVLDCVLESEFDVRILDEGVLKVFRLAQLAVEYQQFCRHYLDRSVFVLKEEISGLLQQVDALKKELYEKEEEIKKIKRRSKYGYRHPLPYENQNIAAMILKTLNNKSNIFPSTSTGNVLQYNKCNFCEKAFLNQLYLKSHISRRHTNEIEIPERDMDDNILINKNENSKLNNEILELKAKLSEMEIKITNGNNEQQTQENETTNTSSNFITTSKNATKREMKDVEISTNNETNDEDYLLKKIEEWKKEEHEKYDKELNNLRAQIIDTINTLKNNETSKPAQNDVSEQLHSTIKEQTAEILHLKQELSETKLKSKKFEIERKKEADVQMSFWIKRAEMQTQQYDALLQKLDEVAKEAHESRAIADAERQRASNLQMLLQQSLNDKYEKVSSSPIQTINALPHKDKKKSSKEIVVENSKSSKSTADRKTLEELHRKAKELLSVGYNSSDTSISSEEIIKQTENRKPTKNIESLTNNVKKHMQIKLIKSDKRNENDVKSKENFPHNHYSAKVQSQEMSKNKETKLKSENNSDSRTKISNGPVLKPGSPKKLVRVKITEEVNKRLTAIGVDPLKTRLQQTVFQKQRLQLQEQRDSKNKKSPAHDKVRHTILAYLDKLDINTNGKEIFDSELSISSNKINKAHSLTSILSNVKNKALAIVKSKEIKNKIEGNTIRAEVAKKAMTLLKTPPGSTPISPKVQERSNHVDETNITRDEDRGPLRAKKNKILKKYVSQSDENSESDEESSKSEHDFDTFVSGHLSKSIKNLINSPAKRPSSANTNYTSTSHKYFNNKHNLVRTQSETIITKLEPEVDHIKELEHHNSSEDLQSITEIPTMNIVEEINEYNPKQTKGVLKNASSVSSINKKKVLFDMDAIQMKSVSTSASQSLTEKNDTNEKYDLGLVNLNDEEWDISSIENDNLKNDTKIQINSRTTPKIAELKQTIESQLARRSTTVAGLVGSVDVLRGPLLKTPSIGGSNTSLGSSILDESDNVLSTSTKTAFVKPKKTTDNHDSELDISELSIEGVINDEKLN